MSTPPGDRTDWVQYTVASGSGTSAGDYPLYGQVVVAGGLSIHGAGPNQTRLIDKGPPRDDGAILIPRHSWGYSLDGFLLARDGSPKTGTGIRSGSEPQGPVLQGTQSGLATWRQVWVDGYAIGYHAGDKPRHIASSEVYQESCFYSNCLVAVRLDDQNTLNHRFTMFGARECGVGLQTDGAGADAIAVESGSASNVGVLFDLGHAYHFSVRDFRAELCGTFFRHTGSLTNQKILIDHVNTSAGTNTTDPEIFFRWGANAVVRDSTLTGYVAYEGVEGDPDFGVGSVRLENVTTMSEELFVPVYPRNGRLTVVNCSRIDAYGNTVGRWKDYDGKMKDWMN